MWSPWLLISCCLTHHPLSSLHPLLVLLPCNAVPLLSHLLSLSIQADKLLSEQLNPSLHLCFLLFYVLPESVLTQVIWNLSSLKRSLAIGADHGRSNTLISPVLVD